MTDTFIDADETQIYGVYAARQIRRLIVPLNPQCAEAMGYAADTLDESTTTVKNAIDASRSASAGIRKGAVAKKPLNKEAKSVLVRFSKHLDTHKPGIVDRKTYFTRTGTVKGVGTGAQKVLQAVVHISTELSKEGCPVENLNHWLTQFREIASDFAPAVEHSEDAHTDRTDATPEVKAARKAWLSTYTATKSGVDFVLRLSGKLHLKKSVFHDLVVPAGTKVTEMPVDPTIEPEEPEPEDSTEPIGSEATPA
jgi:hypothetical protein